MPNGDYAPKNWGRLLILLDAFHQRYGQWPDELKLGRLAREELRHYLGPALYARLLDRLASLPDEDAPEWLPILVRDRGGHSLDYQSLHVNANPQRARLWLGIDPHAAPPHSQAQPEDTRLEWDAATMGTLLSHEEQKHRTELADAARDGHWDNVLAMLRSNPAWVNAARPGGSSGFTPLHQAAYNGAPPSVANALLTAGAWRLLRASSGELGVDIAVRRGHRHLVDLLMPRPTAPASVGDLHLMDVYLHAVINGRAAHLVREHRLRLPALEPLQELPMRSVWMPVPGMTGGFRYWLARGAPDPLVIVESWSRVVDGSSQRHEITPLGLSLVAEAFV